MVLSSGVAPRNSGVGPRNSGVVPRNSGAAPRHSGVAPRHSGQYANNRGALRKLGASTELADFVSKYRRLAQAAMFVRRFGGENLQAAKKC